MKLETLSLRGITRFSEEVRIDFRALPHGLIAIRGRNRAGKTSLAETIFGCTYRRFPTRDREIFDYVSRSDGYIELTFELEGQGLYKARLNLDGPHRKSEGVLMRVDADGSLVMLNDGKVSTYDAAIRQLLPAPELVLASVFSAQNRAGSFASLDRKGRKELFAKLLGLAHYDQLADRAKSAASAVQQSLETLSARRDVVARDASAEIGASLEQRVQQLLSDGRAIESRRAGLRDQVAALEAAYTKTQEAASRHATAQATLEAVTREIGRETEAREAAEAALNRLPADETKERDAIVSAFESTRRSLTCRIKDTSELEAELARIDAEEWAVIDDADRRIAKNRELADRAEAIRAAARALREAKDEIVSAQQRDVELTSRRAEVVRREAVQQAALADVARAERDLEAARAAAARLGSMPFGDDCAPCAFMADAAHAKARIPALEEAVQSRATIEAELTTVQRLLADIDRERQAIATTITTCRARIAEAMPLAKYESDLAVAEERIAGHEQRKVEARAAAAQAREQARARDDRRVEDLHGQIRKAEADRDAALRALVEKFEARAKELAASREAAVARLGQLEEEAARLRHTLEETAEASADAARCARELAAARAEWDATTAALASVQSQTKDARRRLEEWTARRAELTALDAALDTMKVELVEWTTLAKAFGRDGLQVLEIDAAGPTISAHVNDLLRACGMGWFTVELITQEAKVSKGKDGSQFKETFQLKIYDAQGNAERDITDLSGAEQIVVDEALKLAIAIYVNQRSVAPIRWMFRDETTGAFDGENALLYMAMLRRAHEIGGFLHTLFITHNDACAELADAQLWVENGTITVKEPPYTTEAA